MFAVNHLLVVLYQGCSNYGSMVNIGPTPGSFNYAPFEEEGVYCFANVSLLVGRSVDQMVSADFVTECSYFTCRLVMTSG